MIIKILLLKNKVLLNFHLLLFIIMKHLAFGLIILYGLVFVSYDYDKNTPFMFACTLADHSPNTLLLSSVKKYNCWKSFIDAYRYRKFKV